MNRLSVLLSGAPGVVDFVSTRAQHCVESDRTFLAYGDVCAVVEKYSSVNSDAVPDFHISAAEEHVRLDTAFLNVHTHGPK